MFEQFVIGTPSEVEQYFKDNQDKIRGEFVVVVNEK
jgi:16S rRNA C1402 (ribose-2'-O) methylase RsmI